MSGGATASKRCARRSWSTAGESNDFHAPPTPNSPVPPAPPARRNPCCGSAGGGTGVRFFRIAGPVGEARTNGFLQPEWRADRSRPLREGIRQLGIAMCREQSKTRKRISLTDVIAPGGRKSRSAIRATRHRINARRRLRHREAIHPAEMPAVPLHRPARLNAGADFHCLKIEPVPGNRCLELPNHCHRFRFRPPYRHEVTRTDGDYICRNLPACHDIPLVNRPECRESFSLAVMMNP